MLRRWFPKNQILIRAVSGLVVFLLFGLLAGGTRAWDAFSHRWEETGPRAVAKAVLAYGIDSPEATAAIKQMGAAPDPKDLVALLDPTTGKAAAASPAELVGKTPEEMTLAGGVKLPPLQTLLSRRHFIFRRPDAVGSSRFAAFRTDRVVVTALPIYPWSGWEEGRHGFYGYTRKDFGREYRFDGHRKFREYGYGWEPPAGRWYGGEFPPMGQFPPVRPSGAAQPFGTSQLAPKAVLLIAVPPEGLTALRILGGIFGAISMLGFILYWLSVAWWVFADARRRRVKAFAWGLLALLTNLVGVAVYLVARQEHGNCASCGAPVDRKYAYCPHCGYQLKEFCTKCGQEVRPDWMYCTNCGTQRDSETKEREV
ncbi:MAG: zinc ribbon domain-containing protein [Firmicutes bacterium]|nr:zinc ribbon domain-containing protein [Bacillota bacterium]